MNDNVQIAERLEKLAQDFRKGEISLFEAREFYSLQGPFYRELLVRFTPFREWMESDPVARRDTAVIERE